MSEPQNTAPAAAREALDFDLGAVDTWLKSACPEIAGTPEVEPLLGGASNLTCRLRYPEHDLVLRRPPPGSKARSAHDMAREFNIQKALRPYYPWVPEMIALCTDPQVIGCDFYLMQRLDGRVLRGNTPADKIPDPATAGELCQAMIARLVALHRVDWRAAGLATFGRGEGYVARQIAGWRERYARARTWNVPSFKVVGAWLEANMPDEVMTCVIHNDFRLDNLLLDRERPARIVAVLDWEMATLGDPLMDLGAALAYWVEAGDDPVMRAVRRQPSHLPGMMRREEIVREYGRQMGLDTGHWPFYEVYGLFRLAAIAQQIYRRYHLGQTRNPAFRYFWLIVKYLDYRCRRIIRRSGF